MREVLYLNIEGGLLTVREMGLEHPPRAVDVHSAAELESIFWALRRKDKPFDKVRTVIIDNASELVSMELEQVARRKMKRPGDKHESIDDHHLDDRGEVSSRLSRILRWYRDLDVNTIVTAHPRMDYFRKNDRPTDNLKQCVPGFPDALRRALIGYQDFVWYVYRSGDEHHLLTQPQGAYYAKTRGQVFPQNLGQRVKIPVDAPAIAQIYKMLLDGSALPEQYKIETKTETEREESE